MKITSAMPVSTPPSQKSWLDYRTVWRWHFYAGLFCIPFVIWLSITGSIFLFKPQLEQWLDRPYERLTIIGPRATAAAQVEAALAAVPGSSLHAYELPLTAQSAVRVIIGRKAEEFRVYVHPETLRILQVVNEDQRPMKVIQRLHGELLLGDRGSLLVELAASWAIVMILTGLYLWWPRQTESLAGVLFIRVGNGSRIFWRDLHAVTGIWVSAFALFLLFTGLPWAKNWGGYLKKVRSLTSTRTVQQDWTTGRSSELAQRLAMNGDSMAGMSMEHAGHMHHATEAAGTISYTPLDTILATVAPLQLAYPVLISPPSPGASAWTAKSDSQNRPLRANLTLDAMTGAVLKREDFHQRGIVDRMVGVGVAAHEGQLFGFLNQLLGLLTAMGLVLLSVSATVLWWRRRHTGVIGAPLPVGRMRWSFALAATVVSLGLYLPAMGVSLITVILAEKLVLSRIPSVSRWLGLTPAPVLT